MQHYFQRNFLVLCVVGFVGGILYSNCFAKEYLLSLAFLDHYYLNQFVQTGSKDIAYLFHLIKMRLIPFAAIFLLRANRFWKLFVSFFLVWTCFLCGIIFTAATIKMRWKGIFLSLIVILPHGIFYVIGYGLLILYLDGFNRKYMEYNRIIIFLACICIGIVLEFCVNPIMVKFFIKMI